MKRKEISSKHPTPAHNAPAHDTPVIRELSPFIPTVEESQLVKKYTITGEELGKVLRAYGAAQREFAAFIGLSQTAISKYCTSKKRMIKFKYAQELEKFVGRELYITTIANSRRVSKMVTELSTNKN